MPRHKSVYILPNMLTTASLFLGFLGLTWAMNGRYEACALAILGSCLLDGLDGSVARLTNTTSAFGVQFDSLADLVAFGVSPAMLAYTWQLHDFGRLGLMACFLFVTCGALRLARFNVQAKKHSSKSFVGLPIPAAGCTLATLVLFSSHVPQSMIETVLPAFCLGLVYLLSLFMVSTIRFISLKEYGILKAHPFRTMVTALLLFVLVASMPKILGFVLFSAYLISGPVYTIFILSRRSSKLLRESSKVLS